MKRLLIRLMLVALVSLALVLAWGVSARAGADDDLPGTLLAVGSGVTQTVSPSDPGDVYAIQLVAGQEVHIRCDPGVSGSATASLHLLVPGAASLAAAQGYDELIYTLRAGSPTRSWADYDYIPAKSGTYYLWVKSEAGVLNYSLSVERTTRAALGLAADADDIPGMPIGAGTVVGVVSTCADRDDVYAVQLTAGRTATFRLSPLAPYNNPFPVWAYLNLLDPQTQSLERFSGHVLVGLVEAANDKNAAGRKTGEIRFTPSESGTYYVWINAAIAPYGHNFAYQLNVAGSADDQSQVPQFSDVEGSPYAAAIRALGAQGIISGFSDGTFRPTFPVARQQFAKMIVKTLRLPVTGSEVCQFTDVEPVQGPDPFYPDKYVAVCAAAGITKGVTATVFNPYGNITREQLVSMVVRGAGLADPPASYQPPFGTARFSLEEHYLNARKAAYAGLLDGLQDLEQHLDFSAAASRGECAQLLFNLLGRD